MQKYYISKWDIGDVVRDNEGVVVAVSCYKSFHYHLQKLQKL